MPLLYGENLPSFEESPVQPSQLKCLREKIDPFAWAKNGHTELSEGVDKPDSGLSPTWLSENFKRGVSL